MSYSLSARPIIRSRSPSVLNLTKSPQGRDLMLDCTVSAFPKAVVKWKKIDGQLPISRFNQEANGTLLIREASSEDSGTYVCTATNELGTDRKNFTINVFGI